MQNCSYYEYKQNKQNHYLILFYLQALAPLHFKGLKASVWQAVTVTSHNY